MVLFLLLLLCECSEYREPLAVACADEATATTATLQGLVQDVNDDPAADATVTLSRDDTVVRTATTGDDGRFLLDDLDPGTYEFSVAAEGFRALDQELDLEPCLAEAVVTVGADVSPLLIFLPAPYL